jgi:hypothetical protein
MRNGELHARFKLLASYVFQTSTLPDTNESRAVQTPDFKPRVSDFRLSIPKALFHLDTNLTRPRASYFKLLAVV